MPFFNRDFAELSGVATKNILFKKTIVSYFSKHGLCTIADLCEETGLSTPKVNDILLELVNEGIVKDYGKLESKGGRRPNLYGLVGSYGYFLGVDVKRANVNIGITNLNKELVFEQLDITFKLENNQKSLDQLFEIINEFLSTLPFNKAKILAAGVSLPGRINYNTGQSFNTFQFNKGIDTLQGIFSKRLGIDAVLENDSRAMALGELTTGVAKSYKNVLFLNMGHGLGIGIIVNGSLYYGKSGFSGEFGHIPFFDNEIICDCGKKGCLETEASGWALIRKFKSKLAEGYSSTLSGLAAADIKLMDVVDAAINDDVLAIELVDEIGTKLGKGISVLINIFNPEIVVLGGSLSKTDELIRLPIKSALNKHSLSLVNNDTPLEMSTLGNKGGVIGACLLANNYLLKKV